MWRRSEVENDGLWTKRGEESIAEQRRGEERSGVHTSRVVFPVLCFMILWFMLYCAMLWYDMVWCVMLLYAALCSPVASLCLCWQQARRSVDIVRERRTRESVEVLREGQ